MTITGWSAVQPQVHGPAETDAGPRAAHYFRDGTTLCGAPVVPAPNRNAVVSGDCRDCLATLNTSPAEQASPA